MFDLGWTELLLIAVVALVVVGPRELPGALRTVTGLMRRARGLAREFQRGIEDMARESGVDEIKRDIQEATRADLKDDGLDDLLGPEPDIGGNSILNPTPPAPAKPDPRGNGAAATTSGADKPAEDDADIVPAPDIAKPKPAPGPDPLSAEPGPAEAKPQ